MSPSGAELLRQVKSQIDEIDPSKVHELIDEGVAIVDVRETEEFAAGHLPGARHVPRSYLETRIEGVVADRARADRAVLPVRHPLGVWRAHADRGSRLHARLFDDRRHHAVEGPRL